jgi:hypothetical protein
MENKQMRKYVNKLPDKPGDYWYIGDEFTGLENTPIMLHLTENDWYGWLVFKSPLDDHKVSIHCLRGQWSKRLQP